MAKANITDAPEFGERLEGTPTLTRDSSQFGPEERANAYVEIAAAKVLRARPANPIARSLTTLTWLIIFPLLVPLNVAVWHLVFSR